MVLFCDELKVSRSLAKNMRNKGFEIRIDSAFPRVIKACSEPRKGEAGTWLGREMQAAYLALHRAGHAHSFETWRDGELVGGLYGVAIGRMFYGESMFSRATDASKVALVALVEDAAPARLPADRLPACARRCWPRWARARSRGGSFCAALAALVNYASLRGNGRTAQCPGLTTCRTRYCSST